MVPMENNGSTIMYHKVIQPYFKKYEKGVWNTKKVKCFCNVQ